MEGIMGYVFQPEALHGIVRAQLQRNVRDPLESVLEALVTRYPRQIDRDAEWLFNNAGGAMGHMRVLHASMSEYLIFFGTPIGTEGHSGRFLADDWFFVLEGEQWAYRADTRTREVYRPGDVNHLRSGMAKGYRMPDRCYGLEYARGVIPLMLPFGVADTFSSTVDYPTLARTVKVYARGVMKSLLAAKAPPVRRMPRRDRVATVRPGGNARPIVRDP
jgi:C-8 sterol isomerase